MVKKIETIREAAEELVNSLNAFPRDMLEELYNANPDDWEELTPVREGDRVYCNSEGDFGTISEIGEDNDIILDMDDGREIRTDMDDITMERDDFLPMWGTLWSFSEEYQDNWLNRNLDKAADCGFRIYESRKYGMFLGIDGTGYSFLSEHWEPLYQAMPMDWTGEKAAAAEEEKDYEYE
jgi:hypothetical protein